MGHHLRAASSKADDVQEIHSGLEVINMYAPPIAEGRQEERGGASFGRLLSSEAVGEARARGCAGHPALRHRLLGAGDESQCR